MTKRLGPLTIDGIHINEEGDKALAPVQFKALFGKEAPSTTDPAVEKIRESDEALGDSVVTGPTRTNVNDFRAILVRS